MSDKTKYDKLYKEFLALQESHIKLGDYAEGFKAERDALQTDLKEAKAERDGYRGAFETIVEKYVSEGLPEVKVGESLVQNICLELEGSKRAEEAERKVKLAVEQRDMWERIAKLSTHRNKILYYTGSLKQGVKASRLVKIGYSKSIQSASATLKAIHYLGFMSREEVVSDSGGKEYIYKVIDYSQLEADK